MYAIAPDSLSWNAGGSTGVHPIIPVVCAEEKARLHALADGYQPFKNKYVDPPGASGKPSPVFNEKTYSQEPLPERTYRLLALFRYWNIIEYYLPAKHQLQDP